MKRTAREHHQYCTRMWKSGRKIAHATIGEAEFALRDLQKQEPGKNLNVFYCRHCGAWHVGGSR